MYVTINPLPAKPTITRTGPASFCFGDGPVQLESSLSPNGDYDWYKDGVLQGAFTTRQITLDQVSHSGVWTVIVHGNNGLGCPSPESDGETITIYALATITSHPPNRAICDANNVHNGNTTFGVTVSGPARTIQWERFNGTIWEDVDAALGATDGCSYSNFTTATLSIGSADYPMSGYQYRVRLTTTAGGCETWSNAGTLTVNPTPDIDDEPDNTTICEFGNTTFEVQASIVGGSIGSYVWQQERTNLSGTYNPENVYSDWDTPTLVVSGPSRALNNDRHRVFVYSNLNCRTRSAERRLYINPLADITTQPQPAEICVNGSTSFTVVTDGDPAISAYQWQVSTAGVGGPYSDVSGGIYSGETTITLNLTNVNLTYNGNYYRVMLTTPGGCEKPSNGALLTVNPEPLEKTITSAANNICYGTSTDVVIMNSQSDVEYSVYDSNGDVLIGTVLGDGIGAVSVSTPNLTLASYTYYVIARNTTTNCARTNGDDVTINVNPQFTMAALAEDASICLNAGYNYRINLAGGTGPYDVTYKAVGGSDTTWLNYVSGTPIATGPLAVTTQYTMISAFDDRDCEAEAYGAGYYHHRRCIL